jgi:hypothetical protein
VSDDTAHANTDREIWRESRDYAADSIHVTKACGIGINCGGRVIVMPIRAWHALGLQAVAPIDLILFCPSCGEQHIDAPDERTPDWTNPPHKSHLCRRCKHIWRPCDRPTNGVASIQTVGKSDSPRAESPSKETP